MIIAHAMEYCPEYISEEVWTQVCTDLGEEQVRKILKKSFATSLLDSYATGGGLSSEILDWVSGYLLIEGSAGELTSPVGLIARIWDLVIPAAVALFILFWLLKICEDTSSHVQTLDINYWVMAFIQLFIAWAFFQYGSQLTGAIISLGNGLIQGAITQGNPLNLADIESAVDDQAAYLEALILAIGEQGFIPRLINSVLGFIINIICIIPTLLILMQAITRRLTIIIQAGIMPLSFADIFQNGTRSTGFTYIKRFTVSMLHGVAMVWVLEIINVLEMNMTISGEETFTISLDNPVMMVAESLLYSFAAVGMMSAAKTLLNDVFGC